ncbi:MAG: SDR family oxidoreductase [Clostridiales Family XIII bacterium]|jgi:NAD(P)-dependent dehydrogenase (short-subunit alcohol dehydrogenase family)|nr:SDR family oxidoreductase [Clostridiales Family XIII bacterium]
MGRLDGKVSVITGAGSGIGKTVAEVFAREGAAVVLMGRRADVLEAAADGIRAAGGRALAVRGDITVLADVKHVMEAAISAFGKIDILVNNAGMGDEHRPITRLSEELWDEVIASDLKAVFYTCKEALAYMEAAGSGSIINVSSIAGLFGNTGVSYSAAKAGVIGLTKNIAIQFAGTGIRCNAVCPGPTRSGMNPDKMPNVDMEMLEITGRHLNPDVKWAETEDQANAMLFFASDESASVNGQVIVVDFGKTL